MGHKNPETCTERVWVLAIQIQDVRVEINKTPHTLTPSRKRLHLNERLPLIPRRITRDDRFVKFRLVGDVVLGWRPLARAVPEVEA